MSDSESSDRSLPPGHLGGFSGSQMPQMSVSREAVKQLAMPPMPPMCNANNMTLNHVLGVELYDDSKEMAEPANKSQSRAHGFPLAPLPPWKAHGTYRNDLNYAHECRYDTRSNRLTYLEGLPSSKLCTVPSTYAKSETGEPFDDASKWKCQLLWSIQESMATPESLMLDDVLRSALDATDSETFSPSMPPLVSAKDFYSASDLSSDIASDVSPDTSVVLQGSDDCYDEIDQSTDTLSSAAYSLSSTWDSDDDTGEHSFDSASHVSEFDEPCDEDANPCKETSAPDDEAGRLRPMTMPMIRRCVGLWLTALEEKAKEGPFDLTPSERLEYQALHDLCHTVGRSGILAAQVDETEQANIREGLDHQCD